MLAIAEMSPAARKRAQKAYPGINVTADASEVISSAEIDAVAVVTPVWTHYELAKAALENGKHVFVEKPFTSKTAQGEELINLGAKKESQDHGGPHLPLHRRGEENLATARGRNPGKALLLRFHSRQSGLFQHDINVLWDLAPHDLSIMDHLIKASPEAVVATGQRHLNGHEDVAFMTLYFPEKVIAHINVNWLSPVKVRTTLIGGEKRMLVWNDLEADEKVKVYDKGVNITNREGVYELLVNYRSGDMWAPQLEQVEALRQELSYFVECISSGQEPFNDGCAGLRVVKMLEAASESLSKRGALVYSMNSYNCIADDVKLGTNVRLSKFINLYGCEIGDETKIGAFVEIQKNVTRRQALQDLQSHLYLRRRRHRGQRLHRARSDVYQRQLSSRDHSRGKSANRGGLEGRTDGHQEGCIDRLRRHDSVQHQHRRECHRGRRQRCHQRCSSQRHRGRKSRPEILRYIEQIMEGHNAHF